MVVIGVIEAFCVFPVSIGLDFLCLLAQPVVLHVPQLVLDCVADIVVGSFVKFKMATY